jgi:hypothetical protein
MRSSLVVRASDCQCTSCNAPSIRRHSEIWGAADEAVLNIVRKKIPPKITTMTIKRDPCIIVHFHWGITKIKFPENHKYESNKTVLHPFRSAICTIPVSGTLSERIFRCRCVQVGGQSICTQNWRIYFDSKQPKPSAQALKKSWGKNVACWGVKLGLSDVTW